MEDVNSRVSSISEEEKKGGTTIEESLANVKVSGLPVAVSLKDKQ